MSEGDPLSCFACGEQNSADSRFCKFCGRPLVAVEKRSSVVQNPQNRLLLTLVLILLVSCMVFGVFGLLSSKTGMFRATTIPAAVALNMPLGLTE